MDDPSLSTRLDNDRKGRDPVRVVLDTGLKLDSAKKIFDPQIGGRTIVACGPAHDREKAKVLEDMGVTVWSLPLCGSSVGLNGLVERLGRENLISLLIEGGGRVNYAALVEEKVVDKIMFFYAPKIIGGKGRSHPGRRGRSARHGPGPGFRHNPHQKIRAGYPGGSQTPGEIIFSSRLGQP